MYGLTLVAAPAEEPVTTAEAKSWARVEHSADDADIASLVKAAREMAEKLTGRAFVSQTWRLSLDCFPYAWTGWGGIRNVPPPDPGPWSVRLPKAPLQSVSSVQYYDLADALQTLAAAAYDVDAAHDPGRLSLAFGQVWPVTRPKPGAVRITFVAGYGAATAVPEAIKLALKIAVAFWYENRGENPQVLTDLPPASKALLASFWNGELEYGLP